MNKNLIRTLAAKATGRRALLGISLMLAATAGLMTGCVANDDNPTPTPDPAVNELLTDFVKTVPGIEKYQQTQTDYSQADNWMVADTQGQQEADVFYIYPSAYTPAQGEPPIGDVDNAGMRQKARDVFARQATAFSTSCNIYAPYYRQVDGTYCLKLTTEQEWSIIRYQASQDLTRALDYYFKHWNNGKPYILAGHSQGSENLLALLQDYFHQDDAHKALLKGMVAAYAIGFSVTDEYLAQNPDIPFAERHNDVGCIVSWNTEGPANKGKHNAVVKPHAHSINPIYWVTDDTYVPASENLGSLTNLEEGLVEPGIADAQLDLERGVVVVTTEAAKPFAIPAAMQDLFGPESYHGQDYGFFYGDIRRNAEQRIAGFYSQHIKSGMAGAPLISTATADDVGKVIGADGRIYDAVYAATAAGTKASGIIAYVGEPGTVDSSSDTYKGLAIALTDAYAVGRKCQWYTANKYTCESESESKNIAKAITFMNGIACTKLLNMEGYHDAAYNAKDYNTSRPSGASGWFLASMGQWNLIVQGLATKKSGSTVSTGLTMERNDIYTRDNLNSVITDSGGNGFGTDPYWTSSEYYYGVAWIMVFNLGCASKSYKTNKWPVRSVFAF